MNLKMRVMKAKDHKIWRLPGFKCLNKMIDLFKNVFWYIIDGAWTIFLYMLKYVAEVQEAYDEVATYRLRPRPWIYLIRIKAKDVYIEPCFLTYVPDCFKIWEMCEKAVKKYLWLLKYVPDWFVTSANTNMAW